MIKHYIDKFLNLLIPNLCIGCDKIISNKGVCSECWTEMEFISDPICEICGYPLQMIDIDDENCLEILDNQLQNTNQILHKLCEQCIIKKPYFICARSCFNYSNIARKVMLEIKFYDILENLDFITFYIDRIYRQYFIDKQIDFVSPVPMYSKKILQRMYNQSSLMCVYFHKKHNNIQYIHNLLYRNKITQSQVKLNQQDRLRKQHNIILNKKYANMKNKNILIIDDIITTGSTVNECAKILRKNNNNVYILSFARTILY